MCAVYLQEERVLPQQKQEPLRCPRRDRLAGVLTYTAGLASCSQNGLQEQLVSPTGTACMNTVSLANGHGRAGTLLVWPTGMAGRNTRSLAHGQGRQEHC